MTMRLIHSILAACAIVCACSPKVVGPKQRETAVSDTYSILDAKLDEYVASMTFLAAEDKAEECDFIIGAVSDSVTRNHVAVYLYDKYFSSKLMGDEAVAIHLTDNWFTPEKVHFDDYSSLAVAKLFADFNRQSLLGMDAPPLFAYDPDGNYEDAIGVNGCLKILFMYDTSCATCKVESVRLESLLSEYDGEDLELVAFYCGTDAASWQSWRESHFTRLSTDSKPVCIRHLWDPEVESDFQRKYGVLSTPRIFLIDENGVIVGRSLDTDALRQLI